MIYTVHGYEVVRVKVEGIEADSQEQAIKKYEAAVTSRREEWLRGSKGFMFGDPLVPHEVTIEYADETTYYLVDEDGDESFERSRWHDGVFDPDASPNRRLDPAEEARQNAGQHLCTDEAAGFCAGCADAEPGNVTTTKP